MTGSLGGGGFLSRLAPFQGEHGDAGAVHGLYAQGDAVGGDDVAGLGGAAQGTQDEAADGVEVLVWEVQVEVVVDVGDRDTPVHSVGVLAQGFDCGLVFVELVLNLPDQFLDHVLYRNEALDGAPLVYDYRHLQLAALELAQDLLYALRLGDDEAVPDQGPYVEAVAVFFGGPEQVLDVYRPQDVVDVALVDRVAGVAAEGGPLDQLLERGRGRERLD